MVIEKCEKTVYFHVFRDTLYKVRNKCGNNLVFFNILHDVHQKVKENSVFSRFSRPIVQSSQKIAKNSVFCAFARWSSKSVRKQCIFTCFETLCSKFAINVEITSFFFNILHDVHQKVKENSVFSRVSRHFVQNSQYMRKIAFFELFAQCSS